MNNKFEGLFSAVELLQHGAASFASNLMNKGVYGIKLAAKLVKRFPDATPAAISGVIDLTKDTRNAGKKLNTIPGEAKLPWYETPVNVGISSGYRWTGEVEYTDPDTGEINRVRVTISSPNNLPHGDITSLMRDIARDTIDLSKLQSYTKEEVEELIGTVKVIRAERSVNQ